MKKIIIIGMVFVLLFSGCADRKTIGGNTYDTFGLFDSDEKRNPEIQYDLVVGNIVWSVILCETIIAPIYFIGFALWEPVGYKNNNPKMKGVVNN